MILSPAVRKYTPALFVLISLPAMLRADSEDARIHALEERVAKLEQLVERLTEENARYTLPSVPMPVTITKTVPQKQPRAESDLPQELLPNLGKIGAAVSFTTSWNTGAFGLGGGSALAGSVQLPLARLASGRLHYEFSAGLVQSARTLPTTSNVAQVANLAALAVLRPAEPALNVSDALSGTGAAPFAVTQEAKWHAQTVQIVPFALGYSATRWDRYHLRPYAVVGLGVYITTSRQTASSGFRENATLSADSLNLLRNQFGGAPFTGPLIGGQITSSAELQTQGLPSGQGGADLGIHTGAGVDWLFRSGLTLSFDARFNTIPGVTTYRSLGTRWGWRF